MDISILVVDSKIMWLSIDIHHYPLDCFTLKWFGSAVCAAEKHCEANCKGDVTLCNCSIATIVAKNNPDRILLVTIEAFQVKKVI